MFDLIKCHFNYIISKGMIIISGVIFALLLVTNCLCANSANNAVAVFEINIIYFENCFFITKILSIFFTIFLFGNSFISKNDQYAYFILTSNITRDKYLFTKMIMLIIVLFSYMLVLFILFFLIGMITLEIFIPDINYIIAFLNLFFIMIIYGMHSMILILLTNQIYVIIIPFILFLIGSIINDSSSAGMFQKVFNILIVNFINNSLFYDYWHVLFLMLINISIIIMIYNNKDLL